VLPDTIARVFAADVASQFEVANVFIIMSSSVNLAAHKLHIRVGIDPLSSEQI
jgi:hypothetical protein